MNISNSEVTNISRLKKNILFVSALKDEYHTFLKNLFDYSSLMDNKNELGETVLHHVCFYGMIDKFYALINMGAKIEKTNELNNLLHYACFSGKDNFLVLELIKANISPIEKNENGQTSVHVASNKQIANYLHLWCNRNKISIIDLLDKHGNTVLHTAMQMKHYEVAEYWKHHYPELENALNSHNQNYNNMLSEQSFSCIKNKLS